MIYFWETWRYAIKISKCISIKGKFCCFCGKKPIYLIPEKYSVCSSQLQILNIKGWKNDMENPRINCKMVLQNSKLI